MPKIFNNSQKSGVLRMLIRGVLVVVIVMLAVLLVQGAEDGGPLTYYQHKLAIFKGENEHFATGQIVFVGDSITDGCLLGEYYAGLALATYNRGINGDSTARLLGRLALSVLDLAPTKIVLMIGVNDVNSRVEKADILVNYAKILDEIKQCLPNAEVYCVSILPINHDLDGYTSIRVDESTTLIQEINPQIKALAEARGYVFVNAYGDLVGEGGYLSQTLSDDGIHPNGVGYERLSAKIRPYLE